MVVGFDPLVRVGGGCGEADGGVEGGEWRCGCFERDGVDDETGDGVVDGLWWQGGVALGRWVIGLGTSCGAEVDPEGFGEEGSSNDAAADEAAIDVPNLASGSVRETCICWKGGCMGLPYSQIPRRHLWQDAYIYRPSPRPPS